MAVHWLAVSCDPSPSFSSAMNALQSSVREGDGRGCRGEDGRGCRGEGPKSGLCCEKGNLIVTD